METSSHDWSTTLEQLLTGDRTAFLRFNRLVTSCLRQLRAYDFEQEWDDLRQEVLAAVVKNARAGRLRDPQAFVGYVRIVTRNKFMDRLKRRLRHHENQTLPWEEEMTRPGPLPETPDHELRRDLQAALGTLEAEERTLVEGVYVEGRTYQEMADRSGIPLGTLKRRLRASLTRLRERLSDDPASATPETYET